MNIGFRLPIPGRPYVSFRVTKAMLSFFMAALAAAFLYFAPLAKAATLVKIPVADFSDIMTGNRDPVTLLNAVSNATRFLPCTDIAGAGGGMTTAWADHDACVVPNAVTITDATMFIQNRSGGTVNQTNTDSVILRINNTTDVTLFSAVHTPSGTINARNTYSTSGLSISLAAGDLVELKYVWGSHSGTPCSNCWTYGVRFFTSYDPLPSNADGYLRNDGSGTLSWDNASTIKSFLSLSNVENTALSTWAGSANLTTLGTIATGVWNGTVITVPYGGTSLSSITSGSIMRGNGTSAPSLLAFSGSATDYLSGAGTWTVPPGTGSALPANAAGFLENDGAGSLSWSTPAGTLPPDAPGALVNDGSGGLSWINDPSYMFDAMALLLLIGGSAAIFLAVAFWRNGSSKS